MEGLDTLTSLRSLWLGKNKIEKIENIQNLSQLTQLDVQNNRLTSITGLGGLAALEELYLACNAINDPSGLLDLVTAAAAVTGNEGKPRRSDMGCRIKMRAVITVLYLVGVILPSYM